MKNVEVNEQKYEKKKKMNKKYLYPPCILLSRLWVCYIETI